VPLSKYMRPFPCQSRQRNRLSNKGNPSVEIALQNLAGTRFQL
jgi:hypothetical protein